MTAKRWTAQVAWPRKPSSMASARDEGIKVLSSCGPAVTGAGTTTTATATATRTQSGHSRSARLLRTDLSHGRKLISSRQFEHLLLEHPWFFPQVFRGLFFYDGQHLQLWLIGRAEGCDHWPSSRMHQQTHGDQRQCPARCGNHCSDPTGRVKNLLGTYFFLYE